jgi:hypothetical protein
MAKSNSGIAMQMWRDVKERVTKRKVQWCSSVAAITPTDLYLSMSTRTYHTGDGNCSARRQGGVTSDVHMPSQQDATTRRRVFAVRPLGLSKRQRRCNGLLGCCCLSVNERERCSLILPQWSLCGASLLRLRMIHKA